MKTEKHQTWHDQLANYARIEADIEDAEAQAKALRALLITAEEARDAAASDAAGEKMAENLIAIELPDGSFRLLQKARRGKGGVEPRHPYIVTEKVVKT
jgi:hypothetical protein